MALLLSTSIASLSTCSSSSSSSSLSSSTQQYASKLALTSFAPIYRLCMKPIVMHPKSFNESCIGTPFIVRQRGSIIVKASSDIDGTGSEGGEASAEIKEKVVPVENLPLESKQQLLLEQKLKMKLAKKIRLRRKRLVRKRHLRKKGRWPPSKMKKNKNV